MRIPKLRSSMAPQNHSHARQATRLPEAGVARRKALETMTPAPTLTGIVEDKTAPLGVNPKLAGRRIVRGVRRTTASYNCQWNSYFVCGLANAVRMNCIRRSDDKLTKPWPH